MSRYHTILEIAKGHVRCINILTWPRGFWVKLLNFLSFYRLSLLRRDLNTKKTTPNIEVCSESLGAMLEYCYIERGLFSAWSCDSACDQVFLLFVGPLVAFLELVGLSWGLALKSFFSVWSRRGDAAAWALTIELWIHSSSLLADQNNSLHLETSLLMAYKEHWNSHIATRDPSS